MLKPGISKNFNVPPQEKKRKKCSSKISWDMCDHIEDADFERLSPVD